MASAAMRPATKWLACCESALVVDRRGADGIGKAGRQPGVAGDVGRLLPGLGDTSPDDEPDIGRVDARTPDRPGLHRTQQIGGMET